MDSKKGGELPKTPIKYSPVEKKENKFCCPFCGDTKCSRVSLNPGPIAMPSPIPTTIYECGGCSMTFTDPEKFMKIKLGCRC